MQCLARRAALLGLLFTVHAAVASSYHHSCQRTLWHTTMHAHSPFCELHRRGMSWLEVGATAVAVEVGSQQVGNFVRLVGLRGRRALGEHGIMQIAPDGGGRGAFNTSNPTCAT